MDNKNDITKKDSPDVEIIEDEEGAMPDLQVKIKKLKADLARSDKERKEYLDGWQRAKADSINYKKEEGKRLEDLIRFASASMIEELLPVLDSFDLALRSGRQETGDKRQADEQGFLLIRSQLEDVLKKRGVMVIQAEAGDVFNPERHEAIGEVESDKPAGAVAEAVQRGYELAGRVIRPARVRLAKSNDREAA